jgi:hypothetical protein
MYQEKSGKPGTQCGEWPKSSERNLGTIKSKALI